MKITSEIFAQVKILWDYHRIDDDIQKSDLIFCLGSIDIRSARRAAELYLEGFAPIILFSGGVAHSDDLLRTTWQESEAVVFANEAIRLGVPKENILLETEATNTGENITKGFEILQKHSLDVTSMILVQKPYMGKRTYATFKKQWPGNEVRIKVTCPKISFEEYFNVDPEEQIRIINIMVGDLERIKVYPEKGFQIYQEIPQQVMAAFNTLVNAGFDKHLLK